MTDQPTPLLSDLLDRSEADTDVTSRRWFLSRASALSLMIPGVGGALSACSQGGPPARTDTARKATSATSAAGASTQPHNSDSRLDSSVVGGGQQRATTAAAAASGPAFHRFDPTLAPANKNGGLQLNWHAREAPIRITDDTVVSAWTFEGDIPGPIVHCREGDTVEFTLTNDVDVPHSMDFHAAQIDPKQAFRSVAKGQSVTYTFKPRYAGAFMYHCGTAPVLMHIGSGMHGAIIVSPREGLAPAKEFVLVQSEFYLGDAANGVRPFYYKKMLSTLPDYVALNGRPSQYVKD